MESYIWIYIIIGFLGLNLPWLKSFEQKQILNIPIVAISLGLLFYLIPSNIPNPDPIKYEKEILRLTEIAVIISLMGTGLKINRIFSIKSWRVPLLLVVVTMIGCIAATALLGWWFGLVPASALLLGAVFAPTDPVLASSMQVDLEEKAEEEHPVQFNLTAEAGINDGMAFPFTWLAIWVAMYGADYGEWFNMWLLKDLIYRIVGGVIGGYIAGKAIAWFIFEFPKRLNFKTSRLGVVVVAITFLVYGITESFHGYGFIAVFVAALTLRQYEKEHNFHREMHDVVVQLEQYMITVILFLLGGYIAQNWFQAISFPMLIMCIIFIFIIRPVFGIIPTFGTKMNWKERWSVAFLGIKGVGSFFYLAFALHETEFLQEDLLWTTVAFLVVISAIVHRFAGYYVRRRVL